MGNTLIGRRREKDELLELCMTFGGIPYYLSLINKNLLLLQPRTW